MKRCSTATILRGRIFWPISECIVLVSLSALIFLIVQILLRVSLKMLLKVLLESWLEILFVVKNFFVSLTELTSCY